jgi:hypothetical protein
MIGCLAIGLCAACTLTNKVDVCSDEAAPPLILNHRFEGIQKTGSPSAAAALPDGTAVVVFASEVGGRNPEEVKEIRSVRITSEGAPLPSCDRNDGLDDVLIPADATNPAKQLRDGATVTAPLGAKRTGLVTYWAEEAGRPDELWGLFLQDNGCPFIAGSDRRKPFLITTLAPDEVVFGQSVVALEDSDSDDFLVVWEELTTDDHIRSRARLVRMTPSGPEYLATVLALDGGPATLPAVPNFVYGLAPVSLGGGRIAIAVHYSRNDRDSNMLLWLFDDHLQQEGPEILITQDEEKGELLPGRYVASAFDGQTLLVLWIQNQDGHPRLFSQPFDTQGRARGPILRLGLSADSSDSFPTAMAWPGYGFLVGWRQHGGKGDATGPSMMGRLLDTSGRPAFSGLACSEAPFVFAHQADGDRRQPSIVPLQSNDVLAIWTEDSKNGVDSSGSSIQGRLLALPRLFVGANRPGAGKRMVATDAGPARPVTPADGGATDTTGGLCAPRSGSVSGGDRCSCDSDCVSGGQCGAELPEGIPGGLCINSCDPAVTGACGTGGVCRGTAPEAFCFRGCTAGVTDCGPGRICHNTICTPYCASDDECLSGHCDAYRGLCAKDAQPLSGGGVYAKCIRNDDCRSRNCVTSQSRCVTDCHPERPHCPEQTVCIPYPSGDGGLCLQPCLPDGTCADATAACTTDAKTKLKVCL